MSSVLRTMPDLMEASFEADARLTRRSRTNPEGADDDDMEKKDLDMETASKVSLSISAIFSSLFFPFERFSLDGKVRITSQSTEDIFRGKRCERASGKKTISFF